MYEHFFNPQKHYTIVDISW